ncbi:malto-oligosyltrehalose synthase [Rhodococcus sp. HNM0569]|nr:malto-oligosyltrehalose synthase [Rhodococcus sp. HNM0569]
MGATYRLQLRPDAFTFADAEAVLDHLGDLGVTHVYLSPILTATSGSTHGYDVTDPTTVSAGLGGRDGFERVVRAARARGLGIVVDIVPNHVGIAKPGENAWWWDVLTHGRDSQYAQFFDIDWRADNGADGALALPVLGTADDAAALAIDRSRGAPLLAFHEHRFPIAPGTDGPDARAVHERQHYRLVPWNAGVVGYRRFFAVNELAALRQEDPAVFDASHAQVRSWIDDGLVDGLRVDHPDGLADPAGYLARVRALVGPGRWLVVEKILGRSEALDPTLPVDGTTGYDALARLDGVFVDAAGAPALTALSLARTGDRGDADSLDRHEHELKRATARGLLAPEVRRLARAVERDTEAAHDPGHSRAALVEAIVDVVARLPVYRSDYRGLEGLTGRVLDHARAASPEHASAVDRLADALARGGEAATRFQQVAGAVTAKSVEDCLFYRTARLVSLQEVGGDPGALGWSPARFHADNAQAAARWPAAMTTLSTHDTKRGTDVRARIGVLSQVPALWARCVAEWEDHTPSPDAAFGAFLWQNLFGVWPADGAAPDATLRARLHAYAEKAMREAGVHTAWTAVDEPFEQSVHAWIDTVIDGPVGRALGRLVAQLAPHGWSDSLGRTVLHLCGPGVPDVYQGTEVWEDSLVDPDNRRLVDFDRIRTLAAALPPDATALPPDATTLPTGTPPPLDVTGAAKLHVVRNALRVRRARPESFVGGHYTPMRASNDPAGHVLGFARGPADAPSEVVALATRLSLRLAETGWADATLTLPDGAWHDVFTGAEYSGAIAPAELFARYPVALLTRPPAR